MPNNSVSEDVLDELKDKAAGHFEQLCQDKDLSPDDKGHISLSWRRFKELVELAYLEAYLDDILI